MSDTPETQEAVERWRQGKINIFDEMARLERERNEAIASRKASAAEWLINVEQANARTTRALQQTALAERERDEQTAQMCQAIGYLSTIAEDCESWLNGECEEPSMEFIKAVRDYARKAINA